MHLKNNNIKLNSCVHTIQFINLHNTTSTVAQEYNIKIIMQ